MFSDELKKKLNQPLHEDFHRAEQQIIGWLEQGLREVLGLTKPALKATKNHKQLVEEYPRWDYRLEHMLDNFPISSYLTKELQAEKSKITLQQAMAYGVGLSDKGLLGKSWRALLLWAAGGLWAVPAIKLLPACLAMELLHSYSLLHDDLPAMDDDNARRGRAALHVAFVPSLSKKENEALAILAGDALQSLAFEILASSAWYDLGNDKDNQRTQASARAFEAQEFARAFEAQEFARAFEAQEFARAFEAQEFACAFEAQEFACACIWQLARAVGGLGMVRGQWRDLTIGQGWQDKSQNPIGLPDLLSLQREKTGALIFTALTLPLNYNDCGLALRHGLSYKAKVGPPDSARQIYQNWAETVSLIYQGMDDYLDLTAGSETLGKKTGKDAAMGKVTGAGLNGLAAERQRLLALRQVAGQLGQKLKNLNNKLFQQEQQVDKNSPYYIPAPEYLELLEQWLQTMTKALDNN